MIKIAKNYVNDPDEKLQLEILNLLKLPDWRFSGPIWLTIQEAFLRSQFASVREKALSSLPSDIRANYQNERYKLEMSL